MVAVFAGFVAGNDPVIKMLGLGLATAVLVDATVVRLVLVPAVMKLLGRLNWWLPAWLDRLLPQMEGHQVYGVDRAPEARPSTPEPNLGSVPTG
jgi:RND superfamily putative drug exporter